eukprot:7060420-Pyramimonas_sp.AAC.1
MQLLQERLALKAALRPDEHIERLDEIKDRLSTISKGLKVLRTRQTEVREREICDDVREAWRR